MSVNQKLRQSDKRNARREIKSQLEEASGTQWVAEMTEQIRRDTERREMTLNYIDPDTLCKYASLDDYLKAVSMLNDVSADECKIIDAVCRDGRTEHLLQEELRAWDEYRWGHDDDLPSVDFNDYLDEADLESYYANEYFMINY